MIISASQFGSMYLCFIYGFEWNRCVKKASPYVPCISWCFLIYVERLLFYNYYICVKIIRETLLASPFFV